MFEADLPLKSVFEIWKCKKIAILSSDYQLWISCISYLQVMSKPVWLLWSTVQVHLKLAFFFLNQQQTNKLFYSVLSASKSIIAAILTCSMWCREQEGNPSFESHLSNASSLLFLYCKCPSINSYHIQIYHSYNFHSRELGCIFLSEILSTSSQIPCSLFRW